MHSKSGLFITVEGIEGVGKTTAMQLITNLLKDANINFVQSREPGGTAVAEAIRNIMLTKYDEPIIAETELLLVFAARAQHLAHVIKPALTNGQWVVLDRFTDASYAYQGGGRGLALDRIAEIENWVQGDLRPDATLLLDADVGIARARAKKRSEPDRIESEKIQFFERVRACYLQRAEQLPQQYHIINAAKPLEQVHQQIRQVLDTLIGAYE